MSVTAIETRMRGIAWSGQIRLGLLIIGLFVSGKGEVLASKAAESSRGMVVAGSSEACDIGVEILERGGSAMDAAVGVSLALGVGEPYGSGLGGKLVLLHRSGASGVVEAVTGLDSASFGVTAPEARAVGRKKLTRGWQAVAVPGMLPALAAAHAKWGRLEWSDVVRPVVGLAEGGAEVTADLVTVLRTHRDQLMEDPEFRRTFFPDDRVPVVGTKLPLPDLAKTLAAIATDGADVMKTGVVAERIAAASLAGGGWLDGADLAGVEPEVTEPPRISWRGWEVWAGPAPAIGGPTVLLALQALESGDLVAWDGASIARVCAVLQRVYPRVRSVAGDGAGSHDAVKDLLAGDEGAAIATRVAAGSREFPEEAGSDEVGEGSTTHFVVMDGDGNVVSATQSLGFKFGAGVIAPGTGVILNNSMANFAVITKSALNYLQPGMRARSTMSPVIAIDPEGGCLAVGAPGGARIPTAVLQVLAGVGAGGQTLPEAVDAPRFHLRPRVRQGDPRNLIDVEDGFRQAGELRERDWVVDFHSADEYLFGGVNAAWRGRDGMIQGVADSRRFNYAKGQPDPPIEE